MSTLEERIQALDNDLVARCRAHFGLEAMEEAAALLRKAGALPDREMMKAILCYTRKEGPVTLLLIAVARVYRDDADVQKVPERIRAMTDDPDRKKWFLATYAELKAELAAELEEPENV